MSKEVTEMRKAARALSILTSWGVINQHRGGWGDHGASSCYLSVVTSTQLTQSQLTGGGCPLLQTSYPGTNVPNFFKMGGIAHGTG